MEIRFARETDSRQLLEIYRQYIDTTVTFGYVLPTEEEFAGRIREIGGEYPYLVCEEGGRAVGYAYAHKPFERAAYQWDAELSIYLDREYRGDGLGRRLYGMLMEILKLQGVRNVYGCVTIPNPRSERLHGSMGFEKLGTFHHTGCKNGRWVDVAWYERRIGSLDGDPRPVTPIGEIEEDKLREILRGKGGTL